jgi:hypothetical protein
MFCTLVAVTITASAVDGAVNRPVELIVPALADQLTDGLKGPVPCTVALHCDVWPVITAEGEHATATELTDDPGAICTETAVFPDTAGFCMLVAVMVAVAAEAGAVKSPVELIAPTLADQVTAELKLPVP